MLRRMRTNGGRNVGKERCSKSRGFKRETLRFNLKKIKNWRSHLLSSKIDVGTAIELLFDDVNNSPRVAI